MSKEAKILGAIFLQLLIIFGIVFFKLSILEGGEEIVFKIAPVDPRDPLRGDYITFRFENLSSLDYSYFLYSDPKTRDAIYVPIKSTGSYWVAERGASKSKPQSGTFIKGTIDSSGGSSFRISYGVEDYFIPEGTGRDFNFWRNSNWFAAVSVDENGNSVLKKVFKQDSGQSPRICGETLGC